MTRLTRQKALYQILDVGISLETDSEAFLELFDRDYYRFKAGSLEGNNPLSISAHLDERPQNASVRINDKVVSLGSHPAPRLGAYQIVLREIFDAVTDFLVLHAAVLARDGEALMVAGPPGAGKSTLTLKLLENGFSFYSDDFCPIHRKSLLVHPLPRSLWISPGSEAAKRFELDNGSGDGRKNKAPIKPDQLDSMIGKKPCKARWLITLDPGFRSNGFRHLRMGIRQEAQDAFLAELARMGGITVENLIGRNAPLRISYRPGVGLARELRELFKRYEGKIWTVFREDRISPDFTRDPILTSIPNSVAAFHLMQDLKQGASLEEGIGGLQHSPARLFTELNELLAGVDCYSLSVGKLDAMKDLVLGLCASISTERKSMR